MMGMEFDDENVAIPGSYALSVVRIGGALQDGSPLVFTDSAVCDVCGEWASDLWVALDGTNHSDDIFNSKMSRTATIVVYGCPRHYDAIGERLVDEFGSAGNSYEPDELALKVHRSTGSV